MKQLIKRVAATAVGVCIVFAVRAQTTDLLGDLRIRPG